jgi:hypothetical protein
MKRLARKNWVKEKFAVTLLLISTLTLALGLLILWRRLTGNSYPLPNRVEAERLPSQATIEKVWDTGVTLNHKPQVGLRLVVKPPGRPAYRLETKVIISQATAAQLRPGTTLPVTIGHDDPTDVALVAVSSNP